MRRERDPFGHNHPPFGDENEVWAQVSVILWLRTRLTATIPTRKADNKPPGDPIKIKDRVRNYDLDLTKINKYVSSVLWVQAIC